MTGGPPSPRPGSGATVTVASKLPHGLVLQLQEDMKLTQMFNGEPRDVIVKARVGECVVLKGFAYPVGAPPPVQLAGGYALTPNVPAEFWAKWLAQNAEHPAVKGGFVFAHEKADAAAGQARERKDVLSGFEPANPSKLPNEFRRTIETASA